MIAKRADFNINKQINTKIQSQCAGFIDYVIERFANKSLDKALDNVRQVLQLTIYDIYRIAERKMLLSVFEGHLLINYYDALYNFNKEAFENITKKLYSFYQYYKSRLKDDLIRKKILPRIVILLLRYGKGMLKDERLELEEEALEMLIKKASIREMPEILKYKELSDKLDMNIAVNKQIIGFSRLYKLINRKDSLVKLWELLPYSEEEFEQAV